MRHAHEGHACIARVAALAWVPEARHHTPMAGTWQLPALIQHLASMADQTKAVMALQVAILRRCYGTMQCKIPAETCHHPEVIYHKQLWLFTLSEAASMDRCHGMMQQKESCHLLLLLLTAPDMSGCQQRADVLRKDLYRSENQHICI